MGNLNGNKKAIISKGNIQNIKSKYILIKIFDYLHNRKFLNLIKCSKSIKDRIDININDYKKCSEIYSSIEIEIKLLYNSSCRFINIINKDQKYFHIYLNNNNKEMKRDYIKKNDKVKVIKIIIDYQIK